MKRHQQKKNNFRYGLYAIGLHILVVLLLVTTLPQQTYRLSAHQRHRAIQASVSASIPKDRAQIAAEKKARALARARFLAEKQAKAKAKAVALARKKAQAVAKVKAQAVARAKTRAVAKAKAQAIAKAKKAKVAALAQKKTLLLQAQQAQALAKERAQIAAVAKQQAQARAQRAKQLAIEHAKLLAQIAKSQLHKEQQRLAAMQARAQMALFNHYKDQILQAIWRNWMVPPGSSRKLSAQVYIVLAPDGRVIKATIAKSSGNVVYDRSALTAVYRTSPFPVPKNAALFSQFRQFYLTVRPEKIIQL